MLFMKNWSEWEENLTIGSLGVLLLFLKLFKRLLSFCKGNEMKGKLYNK